MLALGDFATPNSVDKFQGDKAIYFDVLGLFTVVYDMRIGIPIHLCLAFVTLLLILLQTSGHNVQQSSHKLQMSLLKFTGLTIWYLIKALLLVVLLLLAVFIPAVLTGLTLKYTLNQSMSWYGKEHCVLMIFLPPMIANFIVWLRFGLYFLAKPGYRIELAHHSVLFFLVLCMHRSSSVFHLEIGNVLYCGKQSVVRDYGNLCFEPASQIHHPIDSVCHHGGADFRSHAGYLGCGHGQIGCICQAGYYYRRGHGILSFLLWYFAVGFLAGGSKPQSRAFDLYYVLGRILAWTWLVFQPRRLCS